MGKKIILVDAVDLYPKVDGFESAPIYKNCNSILRFIRYIHHKINILVGAKNYWLGKWKRNIDDYSDIVVFDSIFDYTPLDYIRKHNPSARIVFCFRNRVGEQIHHNACTRDPYIIKGKYHCELWSYNQADCKIYGMNKYNQFLLIDNAYFGSKVPILQDVYFIGTDKGRIIKLLEIKGIFDRMAISYKIEVVGDRGVSYSEEAQKFLSKSKPYSQVIDSVLHSKCLLDIVENVNYGLTYRGIEALAYKKKLITNYLDIQKEKFYSKNNIFLIGVDDYNELSSFINSPFDESSSKYLVEYTYPFFCNKIINNNLN